jgi:hypothetical protein
MASIKETIHTFTPKGRYEQYRAKHDYLLEQAQDEVRYGLEKKIDHDAKVYARKVVALEVLGTAAVVTGGYFLGREIHRGKLVTDIKAIEKAIHDMPDKINEAKLCAFIALNALLRQSGNQFGEGVGEGLKKSVLENIPVDLMTTLEGDAAKLGGSFGSGVVTGLESGLGAAVDGGKKSVAISSTELQLKVFTWIANALGGKKG